MRQSLICEDFIHRETIICGILIKFHFSTINDRFRTGKHTIQCNSPPPPPQKIIIFCHYFHGQFFIFSYFFQFFFCVFSWSPVRLYVPGHLPNMPLVLIWSCWRVQISRRFFQKIKLEFFFISTRLTYTKIIIILRLALRSWDPTVFVVCVSCLIWFERKFYVEFISEFIVFLKFKFFVFEVKNW